MRELAIVVGILAFLVGLAWTAEEVGDRVYSDHVIDDIETTYPEEGR
jgi:hypothetical protein